MSLIEKIKQNRRSVVNVMLSVVIVILFVVATVGSSILAYRDTNSVMRIAEIVLACLCGICIPLEIVVSVVESKKK